MLAGFLFYPFIIIDILEGFKQSELTMSEEMRYDLFFKEISSILSSKSISTLPIELIIDYSFHNPTINEYSDRIMNKLKKVTKSEIILDLYSPDFISNLLKIIESNKNNITSFHGFWYDLVKFLFKYALLMRKRFANNNDLFEKSVKNIKDIMEIIDDKLLLYLYIKLRPMINFDFSIFKELMEFKIFDHPQLLKIFTRKLLIIKQI